MKPYQLTISEASEKLVKGELTSVDLTKSVLERIESVDDKVKSYINVFEEEALEEAKRSDERRKSGKTIGELDGIPIALKDLICVRGYETTAGSNILKGFISPYDATVTNKLKKAGAIIIGKTNQDAFAHGSSTENSDFFTTKNPWDLERIPGGSSGGSAAAVAADECIGALGTDTGGSIRQPASLCGVVGLKPTYGRVSRYGVIAMASSLDVVGPITKSVKDCAIILEAIAGADELDSTTLNEPVPKYLTEMKKVSKLKVGIPKEYFAKGTDEDVLKELNKAIDVLKKAGAEIIDISLPSTDYAISLYYIIQPAEVSSNLARYDGIKYGFSTLRENPDQSLNQVYFSSRGKGFGDEAKRRIMLGTYVLSAGYYDAYYRRAMKLRTLVKNDFNEAFKKVDVILGPVSPTPAFKIGEKTDDPIQMYLSDIFTAPINPAGIPAMSLPVGFVERDGKNLPVGLQIIAPQLQEQIIFDTAFTIEQELKLDRKPQL
ncbi:MAG: Asp-tRNA(Asn)/Glu-tRNA(Gln) amidotransferase subunit GatA [bacterium]